MYTTINYDDGNTENLGYKSVEIHFGKDEKKFFATGNFVKDWYDMRKFMIQTLMDSETHFCHSSSVDNFIMDGAPYDSAYLHTTDEGDWYKAKRRAEKLISELNALDCLDLYLKFYRCDNATGDKSQDNYEWFSDLCDNVIR